jgi:hypothetical protein
MKVEEFKRAYNETRNGANLFVRHWANQKFQYSDGVEECADCGLYWFGCPTGRSRHTVPSG